jgi:hypothetical protein
MDRNGGWAGRPAAEPDTGALLHRAGAPGQGGGPAGGRGSRRVAIERPAVRAQLGWGAPPHLCRRGALPPAASALGVP